MPKVMWQLALVYLFQWYALFCYWQNSSKSIALSVWNTTPQQNSKLYEEAVSWTGLVNGWYNIVTFLCAFGLVYFAKKYSPKMVHFACLLLAAIGFLVFPHIENKYLLVSSHYRFRNWLGKYDGNSLFNGGKQYSERTLRRVYGNYQYDDCDSNVYSNDNFWIYYETFFK